jgi:transcriptional regulator with XRE-family HTH domain
MNKLSTKTIQASISYGAVLGKVIAVGRHNAGIHQKDMAGALGVTQSAYSRLEKGQSAINPGQLRRIAILLNKTPGTLIGQADEYIEKLEAEGVVVTDQKTATPGELLVGLGVLALLLAVVSK